MKKIRIVPFPNYRITEEAFEGVVGNTTSQSDNMKPNNKQKGKSDEIKVTVAVYNNGEKRVSYALPVLKTDKTFWAVFPDPIQLFLSQAINQYNIAEHIRKEKFVEASLKVKDSEIYFLDSNSDNTNDLYNLYLQHRVGSIIMLVCSLEAFVNSMIPDNFTYRSRKGNELGKDDIQKKLPLKEKVDYVIPLITSINIRQDYQSLRTRIHELNRVRNEIVHLKIYGSNPFSYGYHKIFKDIQKFDIEKHIINIKEYMNLIKPQFVKEEN